MEWNLWFVWRLPNVRELESIVDYERWAPAIDPVFEALPDCYWSSSSYASLPVARFVAFEDALIYAHVKDNFHFVRVVRTTQPGE